METEVILDTDIIIDYLKKKPDPKAAQVFHRIETRRLRAFTTSISAFELYRGARLAPEPDRRMAEIKGLLSCVNSLALDEDAAKIASEISVTLEKRGELLDIRDLLIGAIAKASGLPLLTRNIRHFRRIPDLRVMSPYEFLRKTE